MKVDQNETRILWPFVPTFLSECDFAFKMIVETGVPIHLFEGGRVYSSWNDLHYIFHLGPFGCKKLQVSDFLE